MSVRDLYEVLGVARNASPEEIKSAYRRLARQFHPDVNPESPESEERFKEIGQAYAILSDENKRVRYDRFGTTDDQQADPFFAGGGFGDLFDMFFGGASQERRRAPGRDGDDIRVGLTITLRDVVYGVERTVEYRRPTRCGDCGGTGAEGGAQPERCQACKGSGQVTRVRNTFIGQVRTATACSNCGGNGTVIEHKCRGCQGRGLVASETHMTLQIPAGVDSGVSMKVTGKGGDFLGDGVQGDLFVVIEVEQDDRFERDGTDLYTGVELSIAQAALGDQIEIDGVDETVEIDIPAGTQPGDTFTVQDGGLPRLHGGPRGALHVRVVVAIPRRLSDAQVQLLQDFAELSGQPVPKGANGRSGLLGTLFKRKK